MPAHTEHTCTVSSNLRTPYPTADFCSIAKEILGTHYSLSIVLIGDKLARTLNETHRRKTTSSNVLSFPLSEESGEIFINLARAKREAHLFSLSPSGHVKYLLIHGCLHLKGYTHGSTMEGAERSLLERYHIH